MWGVVNLDVLSVESDLVCHRKKMDSVIAFKYNGPLGYCQSYKNEWCRLLSSLKYRQLPGWQMNGQGGMLRLTISDGCSWPLATVFEPECKESDQLNVDNADMLLVTHLVHFWGIVSCSFLSKYRILYKSFKTESVWHPCRWPI